MCRIEEKLLNLWSANRKRLRDDADYLSGMKPGQRPLGASLKIFTAVANDCSASEPYQMAAPARSDRVRCGVISSEMEALRTVIPLAA
jgi:hypothetical protein